MSEFKPRRCRDCGEGMIVPVAESGRRMPFRNMVALAIPNTLAIPTCNHGGNEWIDPKTAHAIDEALQEAYAGELRKRLVAAIDTIVQATDIPQRRLEQLLGLSVGYVSRLRSGRGDASAQVVSALALLAQDPKQRIKELDQLWANDRHGGLIVPAFVRIGTCGAWNEITTTSGTERSMQTTGAARAP